MNKIKSDKKEKAIVSVITITYNAGKVLEQTIQSIIGQNFTDYEYLIIDGGSKDNTLAIAKAYQQHIDYIISEPDKGIYDAMNKGLQAAQGKYIWFMNAGDEIFDKEVMSKIFADNQDADVIYGNAMYIDDSGLEIGLRTQVTPHPLPERLTWKDFWAGMVVCHQAFIVKKSLAPLFDLNHPYSADIDWEIRCLQNTKSVYNSHIPLCRYLTGGFSKKYLKKSLEDRYKILQKHFGFIPNLLAHGYILLRGMVFSILKRK
jgi:glycosyltransferase involved in cell wall biosynthesis